MKKAHASSAESASGAENLARLSRRAHASQNRLLARKRRRVRVTCSPHSQQKFGLYNRTPLPLP